MSLRIGTNLTSMKSIGTMKNINRKTEENTIKMSSSDRIYKAALDPAGLAISEKMKANIRSSSQAKRNINDGISIFQVAESTLNEIAGVGVRLRELAMQASTDTISNEDRAIINQEFQAMKLEVDRMAKGTTYNGVQLLSGNPLPYELQVGLNNKKSQDRLVFDPGKVDATLNGLGMSGANASNKAAAQLAIGQIDKMIHKVSEGRTELGAVMNRMVSAEENIDIFKENTENAKSVIRDADIAKESSEQMALNIQRSATSFSLQKSNLSAQGVLKLLS